MIPVCWPYQNHHRIYLGFIIPKSRSLSPFFFGIRVGVGIEIRSSQKWIYTWIFQRFPKGAKWLLKGVNLPSFGGLIGTPWKVLLQISSNFNDQPAFRLPGNSTKDDLKILMWCYFNIVYHKYLHDFKNTSRMLFCLFPCHQKTQLLIDWITNGAQWPTHFSP